MSYTKTIFRNGQAPALSAEELNKMGQGIEDAHDRINNDVPAMLNFNNIKTTLGDKTFYTYSKMGGYQGNAVDGTSGSGTTRQNFTLAYPFSGSVRFYLRGYRGNASSSYFIQTYFKLYVNNVNIATFNILAEHINTNPLAVTKDINVKKGDVIRLDSYIRAISNGSAVTINVADCELRIDTDLYSFMN